MGSGSIIALMLSAIAFSGMALLVSKIILKTNHNPQKLQPYECGIPTIGPSWVQFSVGYYLFALIFLVFDVELVFLYPWAVAFHRLGLLAFIEALVFIAILVVALAYAWRKGALEWS